MCSQGKDFIWCSTTPPRGNNGLITLSTSVYEERFYSGKEGFLFFYTRRKKCHPNICFFREAAFINLERKRCEIAWPRHFFFLCRVTHFSLCRDIDPVIENQERLSVRVANCANRSVVGRKQKHYYSYKLSLDIVRHHCIAALSPLLLYGRIIRVSYCRREKGV